MLTLHNLQAKKKKITAKKRVGRGNASGKGTYSTRGMKGQRSRSGGKSGLTARSAKSYMLRIPKVKGFNSIKAHKILATIHFSSMVATNYYKDKNKDNHKAAAYTAFASYATAVLVIKF